MNTRVRVVRKKDPPVVRVYLDRDSDSYREFTRLWMSVMPPLEDEPAYACVVGEVYDNDHRQKTRQKVILDEAQCLCPGDLERAQMDPLKWEDLLYIPEAEDRPRRPRSDLVTMEDIRPALIALKDLYGEDDPARKPGNNPLYLVVPPGPVNSPFARWIQITQGLTFYPPEMEPEQLKKWYPFFKGTDRQAIMLVETPFYRDDPDYAMRVVEALVARDELMALPGLDLWATKTLKNPMRAVSLICAGMAAMDWSFHIQEWEEQDGYTTPPSQQEEDELLEELERERMGLAYFAGVTGR
jgi:hypothetical protein